MHHFKHTTSSDPGTQMVCTKDSRHIVVLLVASGYTLEWARQDGSRTDPVITPLV